MTIIIDGFKIVDASVDIVEPVSGQNQVRTFDDKTQQSLNRIILELQKINTQLALMNDTVLDTGDSL